MPVRAPPHYRSGDGLALARQHCLGSPRQPPLAVLPYKASTLLDTTVSSSDHCRRRGADGVKGLQLASGALALHARHCLGAYHSQVAQPPQAESDPDPFACAKREIMINV